tara:strand:+ start:60 stop:188 length:129 start_codon:yes stop_codon:yes gene_type:complete
MIKKLYIILFLSLLMFSCGKKGDPTFKEGNSKKYNSRIIMMI